MVPDNIIVALGVGVVFVVVIVVILSWCPAADFNLFLSFIHFINAMLIVKGLQFVTCIVKFW